MAITAHFLLSAIVIACLPEIHRRLGIARTTFLGAVVTAAGLILWSGAREPWQLFAAAIPSGAGWAMTSGAALNAIVARWFDRDRPIAIALAFNGASVGGVMFVPLWVWLIRSIGFSSSALLVGGCMIAVVGYLCVRFLEVTRRHGAGARRRRIASGASEAEAETDPHRDRSKLAFHHDFRSFLARTLRADRPAGPPGGSSFAGAWN